MILRIAGMIGMLWATSAAAAGPHYDIDAYESVLKRHVTSDGRVDYAALRASPQDLDRFVQQLATVSPATHADLFPSRDHRLAYWINAYNALVLWAFAREYPEKKDRLRSLLGKAQFFFRRKFEIGGRSRTLSDIEDNEIRKGFGDPRIHFAIVCASASCPWLRREAYRPERLDAQISEETRRFLSRPENYQIDRTKKIVQLSKIFDWFGDDFGKSQDQQLEVLRRFVPEDARPEASTKWKIIHFRYDWSPNDLDLRRVAGG